MLLADAAQVADGKLNLLGGGWNVTRGQAPSALALLIEVSWDETNRRHRLEIALVDSDGAAVLVPNPFQQQQPLVIPADFEVGRPAGLAAGASVNQPLAVNLGPLPLKPGTRYEWRCTVNGEVLASQAFSTVEVVS